MFWSLASRMWAPLVAALGLAWTASSLAAQAEEKDEEGGATPAVPVSAAAANDWSVPVPGWKAVEPGEHPRLLFRKDDLPALRKKAETDAGKVILERLKKQLDAPFTTWHAAGAAFLYQITGDKAQALRAKEWAEQAIAGKANPDGRYTWPGNGQLRAGPCLAALGLAYDLAYDGWDEATRLKVAQGIMANRYFEEIPNSPRHCPGCNHWGAHTGGTGIALLALRADPGLDKDKLEALLAKVVVNARREIAEGYGSRGYYYEGHHCGRLSSNTGLIPFVQAYRVAAGRDLVKNSTNAQWLVTKWVYEFVDHPAVKDGGPFTYNSRGMYCGEFGRSGASSGGDFAQGFGICPAEHQPALLWLYNHLIEPGEKTYDVLSYPDRAAYAFVNWPLELKERNPAELFPLARYEEGPGYCVFRNGWQDKGNLVVTALLGSSPKSGRGMGVGGSIMVSGRGLKYALPAIFHSSKLTYSRFATDGSGVISGVVLENPSHKTSGTVVALPKRPSSLAVDFSGASGAELLVAEVGPQVGFRVEYWMNITKLNLPKDIKEATGTDGYHTKTTIVRTDAPAEGAPHQWAVMTLQKGTPPKVEVAGNGIQVGGQTLTFDGQKITVAKMAAEETRK